MSSRHCYALEEVRITEQHAFNRGYQMGRHDGERQECERQQHLACLYIDGTEEEHRKNVAWWTVMAFLSGALTGIILGLGIAAKAQEGL